MQHPGGPRGLLLGDPRPGLLGLGGLGELKSTGRKSGGQREKWGAVAGLPSPACQSWAPMRVGAFHTACGGPLGPGHGTLGVLTLGSLMG